MEREILPPLSVVHRFTSNGVRSKKTWEVIFENDTGRIIAMVENNELDTLLGLTDLNRRVTDPIRFVMLAYYRARNRPGVNTEMLEFMSHLPPEVVISNMTSSIALSYVMLTYLLPLIETRTITRSSLEKIIRELITNRSTPFHISCAVVFGTIDSGIIDRESMSVLFDSIVSNAVLKGIDTYTSLVEGSDISLHWDIRIVIERISLVIDAVLEGNEIEMMDEITDIHHLERMVRPMMICTAMVSINRTRDLATYLHTRMSCEELFRRVEIKEMGSGPELLAERLMISTCDKLLKDYNFMFRPAPKRYQYLLQTLREEV